MSSHRRRADWVAALLIGAALAAGAPAARASDEAARSLEALLGTEVEGASRHAENSLDAPASVSVFGQSQAAALGHVTVADMLSRLPGIYLTTSRTYSSVGVRGFNRPGDFNARLLMSIDGYRVNDSIYDQALPEYEFPIVADWVKRIELVSGPAASVYGSNALFGVANLVTLDGADAPGLALRAASSGSGTAQLTGRFGLRHGDTDLFIGAALHRLAGETLHLAELAGPAVPGGRIAGLDGTRYRSVFAKLRHREWRFSAASQARDKALPTAPFGTLPGVPGTRFIDAHDYVEGHYDSVWQGDWRPSIRASLTRTRFDADYQFEGATPSERLVNRDTASAHAAAIDARLHYRGWTNHAVLAGLEWRRALSVHQANFDIDPAAVYLDRTDRGDRLGLYLQDQLRLSERWLLTAGLRADAAAGAVQQDVQLSPRLGIVFRPGPQEAVKLLLGRAFRAPNLYELYYADNDISQRANPTLRAERVSTAEAAWERALGERTRLAVNLYAYRLHDLIDFVALDPTLSQYQNVSSARTVGLDLDLEHRGAWQWRSSLSLARARSDGRALTNSPRWWWKGHWIAPLAPNVGLGAEAQAVGRRESLRGPVRALATVNALLRWTPDPGLSIALRVRNLGDAAGADPASTENDLRQVPRERRSVWLDAQAAW
jgi:outer membrane receptor protein involved in Fe transport